MKYLTLIGFAITGLPAVYAQSVQPPEPIAGLSTSVPGQKDWRDANQRVLEAGGWKAYLRESTQSTDQGQIAGPTNEAKPGTKLSLADAIQISLANHPEIDQALAGVDVVAPNFFQLTDHQRGALHRRAELIGQIKSAYTAAVAANERLAYQRQVLESASIAAEIADRMVRVGNLNAIHHAKEQLSYAQEAQTLAKLQSHAMTLKEALIRRLNLAGDQAMAVIPDRLPKVPLAPLALDAMASHAMAEDSAKNRYLSRHPAAIRVRSEARQAYQQYRAAHNTAQHYQQHILPLRQKISEENLLRYNGMLIGVFELLEDAGHQAKAVKEYIDRLEAFWIADAMLPAHLVALKNQHAQFKGSSWK